MLASLLSKPQPSLSVQAKRLVAMRFLIYTGFQTSYFIGVIGTLTYADDASVVATSLAVLFMNVFVILGSFAGGAALDALGPRRHFLLSIISTLEPARRSSSLAVRPVSSCSARCSWVL